MVDPYGTVLSSITDPIGNSITITYSADKVILVNGERTVTYSKSNYYRINNLPPYNQVVTERLDSVTDPQGNVSQYSYSEKDAVATIYESGSFPKGRNPYLLLYNVTYPTGARTTYAYEPNPVTRALGNGATNQSYRISSRYDYASGQFNWKSYTYTDPNGNDTDMGRNYGGIDHFYVNVNDNLKRSVYDNRKEFIDENTPAAFYTNQMTEQAGDTAKKTTYVYDTTRRLPVPNEVTSITTVSGVDTSPITLSTEYDDYGNVIRYTDPFGRSTYTTGEDHLIKTSATPVENNGYSDRYTEFTRDASGRVIKQTISKYYKKDELLYQVEYKNPDKYGNYQTIIQKDDGRNITLNITYGEQYQGAYPTEQSMEVKNADGTISIIRQAATYYPATGLLRSYTDGNNRTTSYQYDKLGRLIRADFADTTVRTWTYRDNLNMLVARDESGNEVYTRWNPLGYKIEEGFKGVVAQGNSVQIGGESYTQTNTFGYDTWCRMQWSKDALWQKATYSYDAWDRNIATTSEVDNAQTTVRYDDLNRTITTQDPEKQYSQIQSLDILGRVLEMREEGTSTNERHTFSYNALNKVVRQTDYPTSNIKYETTYSYLNFRSMKLANKP